MDNLPVIAIRFALYADLMAMMGVAAFAFYAPASADRTSAPMIPVRSLAICLSVAGLLLSSIGMLVLVAEMMGTSPLAIDLPALRSIIAETAIGTAWIVRMAALTAALALALAHDLRPTGMRIGLTLAASVALASLVWTGHAGATEGAMGTIHRMGDAVHMLAAAVWLGGIVCLGWMLFKPVEKQGTAELISTHRALEQFSFVGTIAVALILLTGLVNGQMIVGLTNVIQLTRTLYGWLLLAKLLLFAVMLVLAAANRWRLTPAFAAGLAISGPAKAVRALRKSLVIEGAAMLLILALVAWLGTLEPLPPAI